MGFGGCDVTVTTEDPAGSVRLQESEVGQVVALALRALSICVSQPAPPVGPAMSVAVPKHANRGPRLADRDRATLGPHVVEGDFHRLLKKIKGSFMDKMKKRLSLKQAYSLKTRPGKKLKLKQNNSRKSSTFNLETDIFEEFRLFMPGLTQFFFIFAMILNFPWKA